MEEHSEKKKIQATFTLWHRMMYHTAFQITGNREDAEDAVQNAMCYLAEHPDKLRYDPQDSMTRNLMYIITKQRAYNMVRDRRGHLDLDDLTAAEYGLCEPDVAERVETVLENPFAQLPERYQDVLVLKYQYGYSAHEIAGMFHSSTVSVYRMLARAKAALQKILKESEVNTSDAKESHS